jgi:branched-chain amino acid transport system ATP-binding protein
VIAESPIQSVGAALAVDDLRITFGGLIAIDDLSFDVRSGEMFGVIGPNGAGKTTLLNAVSGLLKPAAGTVKLDDHAIQGRRPDRITGLGVARTFQAAEVFNEFRVVDYIILGRFVARNKSIAAASLYLRRVHRVETADRLEAHQLLRKHGIEDIAGANLKDLPYGLRKLVDLLRALFGNPRLLLLDEPTSGTASDDRELLRNVLREAMSLGTTTILVDHDVQFVSDLCHRVLVMNFGQELGIGEPHEVLSRPDVQAAYVGLE